MRNALYICSTPYLSLAPCLFVRPHGGTPIYKGTPIYSGNLIIGIPKYIYIYICIYPQAVSFARAFNNWKWEELSFSHYGISSAESPRILKSMKMIKGPQFPWRSKTDEIVEGSPISLIFIGFSYYCVSLAVSRRILKIVKILKGRQVPWTN